MARTSKARVFRSTRTAPNVSPAADLTTAFGAGANNTTTAPFAAGQTAYRFNPAAAGSAGVSPPAAPSTATGNGWRDTVAENASETVRYAAGTWTIKARLNKTVMTVNASVTVRLTVIVYRVTSAGAHVAELGRVVFADTALPTVNAAVTVTGGFTTGAVTTFNAGDKVQVEAYVENIISGAPGAVVTAYTVAFVLDEASADGASFTAMPAYDLIYTRSAVEPATPLTTDSTTRVARLIRGAADTAPASDAVGRVAARPRALTDSATASDAVSRLAVRPRAAADSAPASDSVVRTAVRAKAVADNASATDVVVRVAARHRAVTDNAPAADVVARTAARPRSVADSAPANDAVVRTSVRSRAVADSAPVSDAVDRTAYRFRALADAAAAADTVNRTAVRTRPVSDSAPATDTLARFAATFRAVADAAPANDGTDRVINYVRAVIDNIGPTGEGGGGEAPVTPEDIANIANAVWNELTNEARIAGSYGQLVKDRIDATVSSRASQAAVTALGDPAQASDVATLLGRLTAARATALDLLDVAVSSRAGAASVDALAGLVDDLEGRLTATRAGLLDNLDAAVSSRATAASVATLNGMVDDLEARLTAARAALLDNLDAPVSTRATPADVGSGGGGGVTGEVS